MFFRALLNLPENMALQHYMYIYVICLVYNYNKVPYFADVIN